MSDRKDPDYPVCLINTVDNTEPAHPVFPISFQFPLQRFTALRVRVESTDGVFDTSFHIGGEMTDDFRDGWGNDRPECGHTRARRFSGRTGSPKTSSKVKPFPPFAK